MPTARINNFLLDEGPEYGVTSSSDEEIDDYYANFRVNRDLLELRNIATTAEVIVRCAIERRESRGLNYNLDYPKADPALARHDTVLRRKG